MDVVNRVVLGRFAAQCPTCRGRDRGPLRQRRPLASPLRVETPPAPGTVAGEASDSIALVVMAHNTLASYANAAAVPAEHPRAQSHDTASSRRSAADEVQEGYGSEGRRLATPLKKYATPTEAVAESDSVTQGRVDELTELDDSWRELLTDVGAAAGTDLTASIPSLLAPLPAPGDSQYGPNTTHVDGNGG